MKIPKWWVICLVILFLTPVIVCLVPALVIVSFPYLFFKCWSVYLDYKADVEEMKITGAVKKEKFVSKERSFPLVDTVFKNVKFN